MLTTMYSQGQHGIMFLEVFMSTRLSQIAVCSKTADLIPRAAEALIPQLLLIRHFVCVYLPPLNTGNVVQLFYYKVGHFC